LDISIKTPRSTPLVLDEEVFDSSGISSPSDSKDTVIECGSAAGGNNTGGVVLESSLTGFNGNRDWTGGKSVLKSRDAVNWDVSVSSDSSGSHGSGVQARSSSFGGS